METPPHSLIERIVSSIGSVQSLVIHTVVFAASFLLAITGLVDWPFMLLVLTTILSLEAIYLAIFIQITVNRQAESLREVEENIDEIQEDVEELGENVDEIQEDIEEIQEDVEEISEEEAAESVSEKTLDELTEDIKRVLADLETLKKKG